MAFDPWPIIGVAAMIIGLAIGIYVSHMEAKERVAILEKANGKKFIGTIRTKVFHHYTCGHVKNKYRKGKGFEITFSSMEEAEEMGYRPCRLCL